MLSVLKGYRSYLVGLGFVVAAAIKFIDGNYSEGLELLGQGAAIIFVRSGINSVAAKVTNGN